MTTLHPEIQRSNGKIQGQPSDQKDASMDISSPSMDQRNCDKCGNEKEGIIDPEAHTCKNHDESI